ncbi:MAG: hypothetical protein AAGK23_02395 [Pseudomonadota bacterium]
MADGSAFAARNTAVTTSGGRQRRYKLRKYKVDCWATDFNTAEIGILKRTQNEAASDQFTKDMEIYGQTVIDGKREALFAYRKELWDKNKDFERRLVIKLFSETLSWRGTIELLVGRSLQLTRGSGVAVPAFSINLARHQQLIEVERCARKWPFFPERFTFFLQTKSGPRFYTLRRHMISFGADYSLYDQQGRKIGHLDQKLINLGGAWIVKLDAAHTSKKLEAVLELFCAMLKFNGKCRRHIGALSNKVRDGKIAPKLSHRERDLYYNPRRRR